VIAVGVPEISPVDESSVSPDGRDGETDQDVIVPPLTVGVTSVIAVPLVSVKEFGLYVRDDGATSLTTMVTVAVVLPPLFVAVIVTDVEDVTAVGVPERTPVEKSKLRPAGRPRVIPHVVTVPPL
jgi:hypothetical protein